MWIGIAVCELEITDCTKAAMSLFLFFFFALWYNFFSLEAMSSKSPFAFPTDTDIANTRKANKINKGSTQGFYDDQSSAVIFKY